MWQICTGFRAESLSYGLWDMKCMIISERVRIVRRPTQETLLSQILLTFEEWNSVYCGNCGPSRNSLWTITRASDRVIPQIRMRLILYLCGERDLIRQCGNRIQHLTQQFPSAKESFYKIKINLGVVVVVVVERLAWSWVLSSNSPVIRKG